MIIYYSSKKLDSLSPTLKRTILCFTVLIFLIGVCSCAKKGEDTSDLRTTSNNEVQIMTDTAPIYKHFPTLPKTDRIEWYSISSDGIGLSTVQLCVFSHYDSSAEIDDFLQEVTISDDASDIDFMSIPDSVDQNDTWNEVLEVPFCFQEGIPSTKLINTRVYVNSTRTIIYIDAIGE